MQSILHGIAQAFTKFYVFCGSEITVFVHRCLCRGKGPLKNTSDVISAAKKIAEAGSRMDKLGRTIADNVSQVADGGFCRRSATLMRVLTGVIHLFLRNGNILASYFSLSLWNMQLNCGFFGFLLFSCRLKILCKWICCVVHPIKSHLYICARHISIAAVSPLSCDAAEDALLCCPHNEVEKEKLGYSTLTPIHFLSENTLHGKHTQRLCLLLG